MAIRVVVAEDHALLREGLLRLLDGDERVDVVGEAEDLPGLVAEVAEHDPDVLVTDIRMPPSKSDEGVRAAAEFRETRPDLGVVVLSQYVEPPYALALFAEGSEGRAYLLKERVGEVGELVEAIERVATGGTVIDPKVVEALVEARASARDSTISRLTPRETDVLGEMAQGKSNAAIADALVLSQRAVEKHSNSIFSKLDLTEDPTMNRRVKAVLAFLSET